MSADALVMQIAEQLEIDRGKTEKAVGILLNMVKTEADPSLVPDFMNALPGAEDLADAHDEETGGLLGAMEGAVGGGAMAAFIRLWKVGLTPQQIRSVGEGLFGHMSAETSEEEVKRLLSSIPGMDQHL